MPRDLFQAIDQGVENDEFVKKIMMSVNDATYFTQDYQEQISKLRAENTKASHEQANALEQAQFYNHAITAMKTGQLKAFKRSLERQIEQRNESTETEETKRTMESVVKAMQTIEYLQEIQEKYEEHPNQGALINLEINRLHNKRNIEELNKNIDEKTKKAELIAAIEAFKIAEQAKWDSPDNVDENGNRLNLDKDGKQIEYEYKDYVLNFADLSANDMQFLSSVMNAGLDANNIISSMMFRDMNQGMINEYQMQIAAGANEKVIKQVRAQELKEQKEQIDNSKDIKALQQIVDTLIITDDKLKALAQAKINKLNGIAQITGSADTAWKAVHRNSNQGLVDPEAKGLMDEIGKNKNQPKPEQHKHGSHKNPSGRQTQTQQEETPQTPSKPYKSSKARQLMNRLNDQPSKRADVERLEAEVASHRIVFGNETKEERKIREAKLNEYEKQLNVARAILTGINNEIEKILQERIKEIKERIAQERYIRKSLIVNKKQKVKYERDLAKLNNKKKLTPTEEKHKKQLTEDIKSLNKSINEDIKRLNELEILNRHDKQRITQNQLTKTNTKFKGKDFKKLVMGGIFWGYRHRFNASTLSGGSVDQLNDLIETIEEVLKKMDAHKRKKGGKENRTRQEQRKNMLQWLEAAKHNLQIHEEILEESIVLTNTADIVETEEDQKKIVTLKNKIEASERLLKIKEEKRDNFGEADTKKKKIQLEAINTDINTYETNLEGYRKELAELEFEVENELRRQRGEELLEREIPQAKEEKQEQEENELYESEKQDKLESLKKELERLDAEIDHLSKQGTELKEKRIELESKIALESRSEKATDEAEKEKEEIEKLKKEIDDLYDKEWESSRQRADIEKEIQDLEEGELEKPEKSKDRLINEARNRLFTKNRDLRSNKRTLQRLHRTGGAEKTIKYFEGEIEKDEAEIIAIEKELKDLENRTQSV